MELKYDIDEEKYVELILSVEKYKRNHIFKCILLCLIPTIIFTILSIKRYQYDIDEFGYLTEKASPVILVYIICAALWIILLPMLYTKLKDILYTKEIEDLKMSYGEVEIILSKEGIVINNSLSKIECSWSKLIGYKQYSKCLGILLVGKEEFLIPLDSFENQEKIDEFINYINTSSEKLKQEEE